MQQNLFVSVHIYVIINYIIIDLYIFICIIYYLLYTVCLVYILLFFNNSLKIHQKLFKKSI